MYKSFLEELNRGSEYGVFIDDTGSPGLKDANSRLHPDRKTWVAVVVRPSEIPSILAQIPEALSELLRTTGASEFHFADIYGGTREFKGLKPAVRIALFEFMAEIFSSYGFPILVQTLDPVTLSSLRSRDTIPERLGPFDLMRPEHAALLILLVRVKAYLENERAVSKTLARVFVDEGFKKSGEVVKIPGFESVFANSSICFARSSSVLPLQLADFAAFNLNRMQVLAEKERFKASDVRLLEILQKIQFNYVDLEKETIELIPDAKTDPELD